MSTGNRRIVRLPIDNAIQRFRNSIEARLKGAGYDKDFYLSEVLREFDKSWSNLQRWVDINHQSYKCCWTGNSDSDKKTQEKSWSRGSDDDNRDGQLVISSLRDVADEIPVARRYGIQKNKFGFPTKSNKIPEGHLFSHTSPGSIWERDGRSYLTLGIHNWQNYTERADPPMSSPIESGGVQIKERQITFQSSLLGNRERSPVTRIRALPTNDKNHGWVTYTLFPRTHRCEDGHLSQPSVVKDGEDVICAREGCGKIAIQQRFVSICKEGHLHDFNYWWWVHRGSKSQCKGRDIDLELRRGHAFTLGSWVLKCTTCGRSKDMRRVPTVSEEDPDASSCGRLRGVA